MLTGEIFVNEINNTVFLNGNAHGSEEDYKTFLDDIKHKYENKIIFNNLSFNKLTVVSSRDGIETTQNVDERDPFLDEVKILYVGMLPTNMIKESKDFKVIDETNKLKIDNVVKVLGAISPIVLDKHLEVIDGNLRLQLAKENEFEKVPVVIYDCDGRKADALRLFLNRSSEFQRWNYEDIDPFVDDNPQIQPLAEPLGFFGTKLLPTSFFSNTVINYVIDPFNKKQTCYRQEEGLAEWAAFRRQQMQEELEEKYKKRRPARKAKPDAVFLFDLLPTEDDFVKTEDPYKKMHEIEDKWEKEAAEITHTLDEIKKKEIEEKGGVWQTVHITSTEAAQKNRDKFIKKIKSAAELSDSQKSYVIDNIDDFAGMNIVEIKAHFEDDMEVE